MNNNDVTRQANSNTPQSPPALTRERDDAEVIEERHPEVIKERHPEVIKERHPEMIKERHPESLSSAANGAVAVLRKISPAFKVPKPRRRARPSSVDVCCTETRRHKHCVYCRRLDRSGSVTSTCRKTALTTRSQAFCDRWYCVYVLTCGVCRRQFVGFAEGFMRFDMVRHAEYVSAKAAPFSHEEKVLALHFRDADHLQHVDASVLQYHLLEFLGSTHSEPAQAVRYWQQRLQTQAPRGLNFN